VSQNQRSDYHILVAVGHPEELEPLLAASCAVARTHEGHVTLLSVTPDGQRPTWLAAPERRNDVPIKIMIRLGHSAGGAILAVVREISPDLLLLGWSGAPGRGQYLLGSTLDPLIRKAPCNIAVLRIGDDAEGLSTKLTCVERALVLFGGGPNATLAVDLALDFSPDVQVTALNVAQIGQGSLGVKVGREQLDNALTPWSANERVQSKVVQAPGIIGGILNELKSGYDLALVGASHESYLDRMLFGNVPQTIAAASSVPTIVVKRDQGQDVPYLRWAWQRLFGAWPVLTVSERATVYRAVRRGARPDIDFFTMIGLSAAIAALGLLLSSPAVIIGAMLVAPLMSAIVGIGLGIVQGDWRLLRLSIGATLRGMLLAVAVGALVGLAVPGADPTPEILGRAHPSLLDLGVALVSGAAGAYAICRQDVSAALPGVAIAAALVPPLAAVGIGLALRDEQISGGALLLFITNLIAISVAAGLVFIALGFRPELKVKSRARVFAGGAVSAIILLLAVTLPLGLLTIDSLRQADLERRIRRALEEEITTLGRVELVGWKINQAPPLEPAPTLASDPADMVGAEGTGMGRGDEEVLRLEVQVRAARSPYHQEVVDLQTRVAARLQRPIALVLVVIPITQLDPVIPPTSTPTAKE